MPSAISGFAYRDLFSQLQLLVPNGQRRDAKRFYLGALLPRPDARDVVAGIVSKPHIRESQHAA